MWNPGHVISNALSDKGITNFHISTHFQEVILVVEKLDKQRFTLSQEVAAHLKV